MRSVDHRYALSVAGVATVRLRAKNRSEREEWLPAQE
jgi:hypothetical protein